MSTPGLGTAPLVFLDTETTGLHADRRPWEIAMIRRDEQGQRAITIQVSDVDTSNAELIGLKIGRFHERHLHFSETLSLAERKQAAYKTEADAAFAVELWTRDAHIVGAVPNFDTETLAAMLRRHGMCPAWHYHLADVETLALGWLAARGTVVSPPWRSDEISRAIGVEPPSDNERHTAMGDAAWAMRIWDHVFASANEAQCAAESELERESAEAMVSE